MIPSLKRLTSFVTLSFLCCRCLWWSILVVAVNMSCEALETIENFKSRIRRLLRRKGTFLSFCHHRWWSFFTFVYVPYASAFRYTTLYETSMMNLHEVKENRRRTKDAGVLVIFACLYFIWLCIPSRYCLFPQFTLSKGN